MNSYFTYPHKDLWNQHSWDDRHSPLIPLVRWIEAKNREANRICARPLKSRRTEGQFDPKAHALTYPEVVEYWKNRGLRYHCTSMTLPWIAMIPTDHRDDQGYGDPMDTVLVLINADFSDPSWCMYALEKYRSYLEAAIADRFALIFVASDSGDETNQYISILQEAIILFHLNYTRMYLDVGTIYQTGFTLQAIQGFSYPDKDSAEQIRVDQRVRWLGPVKVLEITDRWTNKDSLLFKLITSDMSSDAAYDRQKVIDGMIGCKMAQAMALEHDYDDARDPSLLKLWESKGLTCAFHEHRGEQWITFVPLTALGTERSLLPCMCIFQEVNRFDSHQAITGFAYYHEFIQIAAQGECMLIFFALESLDANDMLDEIIENASKVYPLDRRRVYVTGHSHNGRFAAEYMRRHKNKIAALATLGNEPGQLSPEDTSGFFQVSDEQIAIQASVDMPTINISGHHERNAMFPLYSDAPHVRPGQWVALNTWEKRVESWRRRLRSARCPDRTVPEILATRNSHDCVERTLGIPADRTEVLFIDGSENYIADIKNSDGNHHLRIVALGDMPHTVTPTMIILAWSFVRRFARDLETGSCIELY